MLIPWFQHEVSIEQVMEEGSGNSLNAKLVDPEAESQEQKTYRNELVAMVRNAMANLNERERHIIQNRFGIMGGHERTHEEIAAGLNLSRERVRQLESAAKNKLRRFLNCCAPRPLLAQG